MTTCQACGIEIIGRDRFCRNCGAPVAVTVEDLTDTSRFNPPSQPSATSQPLSGELTNPFYAAPSPPYPAAQGSAPAYQTAPVSKNTARRKYFLPLVFMLFCLFIAVGFGVSTFFISNSSSDEQDKAEQIERAEIAYDEAVQNALGFKQGSFSDAEFPDVRGIFVNSLMSDDSPAALARIQAGDVLMELNGQVVRNNSELSQVLDSLKLGEEVPVKFYRDGETMTSRIKIADRSFPPLQPKTEPRDQGFLGIKDSTRRCCIPGTKKWGIEIYETHDNSPVDLFGLRPGDVITEFNGQAIRTPSEFNRRIRALKPRSKVLVKFFRGNTEQTVEVIMGHRW